MTSIWRTTVESAAEEGAAADGDVAVAAAAVSVGGWLAGVAGCACDPIGTSAAASEVQRLTNHLMRFFMTQCFPVCVAQLCH